MHQIHPSIHPSNHPNIHLFIQSATSTLEDTKFQASELEVSDNNNEEVNDDNSKTSHTTEVASQFDLPSVSSTAATKHLVTDIPVTDIPIDDTNNNKTAVKPLDDTHSIKSTPANTHGKVTQRMHM